MWILIILISNMVCYNSYGLNNIYENSMYNRCSIHIVIHLKREEIFKKKLVYNVKEKLFWM